MPNRGPHRTVKRRPPRRAPQERVLVVCEGEYTEPRYFAALRDHLRLNTLVVKPTKGVDPRTLVNMASKEAQREKRNFEYVRAPYTRKGSASPCDVCIRDLRQHLPAYRKGDQTTFDSLWHLLEQAVANGRKAATDAAATGENNPSTEVHELVVHLQALSETK